MNPIQKNHDALLRTGAMALAAAGASTVAHAATVQITFNNSFISTTSGNHLVTDFGGDGTADVLGRVLTSSQVATGARVALPPVGMTFLALGKGGGSILQATVGGVSQVYVNGPPVAAVMGVVAFTLVDAGVRGGAATAGWLDATATGRDVGEFGRVAVHRFIFDDASGVAPTGVSHSSAAFPAYGAVVPEPSGLGLLALGAGGLLARRRRAPLPRGPLR